jgi:CHAT domain-containing protein
MQKTVLISLITWICFGSISAQAQKTYSTWNEVAQGIVNGELEAARIVYNYKQQIESSDVWTKDTRDNYITSIRLLNEFCSNQGAYQDQETILNDAIRLFNQRDSIANNAYTRLLLVYKMKSKADIKDYSSALNCGHEAQSMYENDNDYGLDYCMLCINMSTAYFEQNDLLSAKLYIDEAYDIAQRLSPSEKGKNWHYYLALNIRGLIYSELRQYDTAIANLKEVVDNASPGLLASHYYLAMNNLASAYLLSNKTSKGIETLKKVPETTPDLRYSKYSNLAGAYYMTENNKMASEALDKFNKEAIDDAFRIIANFSEVERETYLSKQNPKFIGLNNIIASKNAEKTNDAFEMNVFTRQISSFVNQYLQFQNKGNSELSRLDSLRQALIEKGLSTGQRDSLRSEIVKLEKEIIRSDTAFMSNVPFNDWSFDKTVSTLKDNEAIVLFCYDPTLKSYTEIEAHYGAFILKKEDKHPKLVQLAEVDTAENIFFNNPTPEFISQLYSEDKAKQLYLLLWEPLQQHLDGVHDVYYSTIGPLSLINFDALVDEHGMRLRDKYNMVMLSSPSEKANFGGLTKPNSFMAFGSPAFNLTSQEMADNSSKYSNFSGEDISQLMRCRGENFRGDWQEIPGTKREIEAILPLIKDNGIERVAYFGKDASEEAFKAISGESPNILHVATHGFAISNQQQYDNSDFAQSVSGLTPNNSYMLWSGLVLSGGNTAWKGEQIPDGVEDGILTADEIARMDLSNTDLVVLSACETARGHIDPIEGVWGLQRAFKQAGAKTILMTLWKVSDDVTAMFMEQFYKNLLSGKTVRQSVKKAQDYLISHGASDPFYWAPFVVLD